jgi:peptidoglycan/xylan/chitin deacetylase (PgdA/CDA1 family)
MALRHTLAGPALAALRMLNAMVPGRRFRILLVHDVPPALAGEFERFVAHVKETHGVLTPEQAAAWLDGRPTGETGRTPCLFTFDDGFASNFQVATGALARHDVKAVFFVCPGLIDLTGANRAAAIAANVLDGRVGAAGLPPGLDLMEWPELAELTRLGHAIGAHGMTHRRLSLLDGEDLRREVTAAGDVLEDRLGRPVPWYAYSFGDIGSLSAAALKVIAGRYRFCRSGVRGANDAGTGALALRADQVDPATPFVYQKLIAEGGLAWRYADARRRLDALAIDAAVPAK